MKKHQILPLFLFLLTSSASNAEFLLQNKAPESETDAPSYGRGAAMVDLDGDGLLDLISANDLMVTHFYRQLPDHSFVDAIETWGIPEAQAEDHTWGVLAADFDNDGDDDVYFLNLGYPEHRNRLLRNDIASTGAFTDVTGSSGDAVMIPRNFGGTTLDYNNDGLLDIFLTGPKPSLHNFLLRNDGNLSFSDVSESAGFTKSDNFRHCSAGDYNNDGCIDLAVGVFHGSNYLYRNNCDGTFTDVAAEAGITRTNDQNFGFVFEDFDNDGWMDLWAPKYYWQGAEPGQTGELYRNNGNNTFSNVTAAAGLTGQSDMGHSTGDVNGDGYPDIYIGTGHPGYRADDLLLLVKPNGKGGFTTADVSVSSGITSSGETRSHGMAFGDYDLDGRIDIWVNNGGPPIDDGDETGDMVQIQESFLWNGSENDYNWIALQLTGTESNRTAVGTRIVTITSSGREIHRMLRVGHGFANTDSHIQHFGLGNETTVKQIVITWPSGSTQTIINPAINQVIQVTEEAEH